MGASITLAGENLIAQKQGAQQILTVSRFILANVPGLDPNGPVDRAAGKPAAGQIVDTYDVTDAGYVNPNQVVYSLMMGSDIGDFDWNWIGLETAENVLLMVAYVPTQQKRRNIPPLQLGNNVTRNFLVVFDGAQALTGLTIDASTWQHDFTVRLAGIDERERQSNRDIFGRACFFGSALQLEKVGAVYQLKPGTAYVEGVRLQRSAALPVVPPALPTTAWLDVALQRELSDVVASWSVVWGAGKVDYVDSAGVQHYCVAIADLPNSNTITDSRPVENIAGPLVAHFQPKDPTLTALAVLDTSADKIIYATSADQFATADLTPKARTLLGQTDEAAMRSFLGLVKQTSHTDATEGALMRVGAFGWGSSYTQTPPFMSNMNGSETAISGLYRYATNTVGRPDFGSGFGALINAAVISSGASENYAVQLTLDYAADSIGFRRLSGPEGWRPFREIWHSGNLNPDDYLLATANAVSASKLQTARSIGGVNFDGTANINLPGVNQAGNQNTSGNAGTASKLAAARTINGVPFDGSNDITAAFGWGSSYVQPPPFMSNMTGSETAISGLYRYATNTVGRPDFGSGFGALINAAVISSGASENYAVQLTLDYAADSIGFRRLSGSEGWRPFREIWHSGNLNANDLVPPGTVANFARSTPPPGWLKANGAAVSRTSYSALFAAIGTTFGAGDGSTTFNLPDDRGHFTRSWDDGAGVDQARAFGSKQAGTFIASGSGPTGDGITTFAVNPGAAGRNDLSMDAVSLANYPNARYTNPGNTSTPNGVPTDTDMTYGAVRPRNIAYLSCIKY